MTESGRKEDPFWLKNMIVLGHGAPNRINSLGGRQGRCLCLWSEDRGYCRVYPVPYGFVHDWEVVDFHVRLPKNDGRENSFTLNNYETNWDKMWECIVVHKDKNNKRVKLSRDACIKLTHKLAIDTFSNVRDNARSFGIINPTKLTFFLRKNGESSTQQTTLVELDHTIMDQNDFKWLPYIQYECPQGCISAHPHTSKIVEWGCYQFMRKHPDDEEYCKKLGDNLHISDDSYEKYLLIRNIKNYPKTYIIVKVIRFKK